MTDDIAAETHHTIEIVDASGRPVIFRITCPYPSDSTECGLWIENENHDENACAAEYEGEDGCEEEQAGYVRVPGCSLKQVQYRHGLALTDMGIDDPSQLPVGVPIPMELDWEGWHEEEMWPRLTPLVVQEQS